VENVEFCILAAIILETVRSLYITNRKSHTAKRIAPFVDTDSDQKSPKLPLEFTEIGKLQR